MNRFILSAIEYYRHYLKMDDFNYPNIDNTNMHVSFLHPNINIDFNQTEPEYYLNKRTELEKHYSEQFIIDNDTLLKYSYLNETHKIGDNTERRKPYSEKPIEAFELFKNYYAYADFLFLVSDFLKNNLNKWDTDCIKFKIDELNIFISKSKKINPTKAFKNLVKSTDIEGYDNMKGNLLIGTNYSWTVDDIQEYIKLDKGYYNLNHILLNNSNIECKRVYSLYFLFYSLLMDKLKPKENKSVFPTNLTIETRQKLCDEIINNKGKRKINLNNKTIYTEVFLNISMKHKPTLSYLFGGVKPEKIEKINIKSHQAVYELLLEISAYKNRKGKICLPDILTKSKSNICKNILLKNGKSIRQLHNNTKTKL